MIPTGFSVTGSSRTQTLAGPLEPSIRACHARRSSLRARGCAFYSTSTAMTGALVIRPAMRMSA
jgi:hypothetical protein